MTNWTGTGVIGGGRFTVDYAFPPPEPAPVTTIAWRMAHLTVHVLGKRAETQFGGPPVRYEAFPYADTAATALEQLDQAYRAWCSGLLALTPAELGRVGGPAEGPFAERPLAALVLHIHREVLHHGAEIALLRDLYLHGGIGTPP